MCSNTSATSAYVELAHMHLVQPVPEPVGTTATPVCVMVQVGLH